MPSKTRCNPEDTTMTAKTPMPAFPASSYGSILPHRAACRLLGAVLLLAGGPALAATATPTLAGAPRDGWIAYHVPILVGRSAPCCHDFERRSTGRICDLDG